MKTLGKIAGGIGLLLALTSPLTLFVTSGSTSVFLGKLGLGVVLLALWAFTNGERLSTWARSAFYFSSSVIIGVIFIGILVAVNFIVAKRPMKLDLTNKKVNSLSAQTETTLKELTDPIAIISFVDGPPPEAVEQLFKRYQTLTDKLTYEFKDPRKTPDLTAKYQIREGQPAAVLVRKSAQESHTLINLGRLANPQMAEQELTNGIIKLNTVGTQKLYFVVGHDEWPLEAAQAHEGQALSLSALKRVLEDEGYAPQTLNLVETPDIPRDASALVIAGPRSKFTDPEKKQFEKFLEEGGRLLLFADVGGDAELDELLAKYGVQIDSGMVADPRVSPDQPYIVISPFFGDHQITRLLQKAKANVVFATTHALTVLKEGLLSGVSATPLVLTTPYAWVETTLSEEPTLDSGEKSGQMPLAVAVTRPTPNSQATKRSDEARLVIFGDSEILTSAFGYDPNRDLVMNSIAWATQQGQKITIRPPDRDLSTIDLTTEKLATIRLISMDVLPMLLIGVGLTIWLSRRAR